MQYPEVSQLRRSARIAEKRMKDGLRSRPAEEPMSGHAPALDVPIATREIRDAPRRVSHIQGRIEEVPNWVEVIPIRQQARRAFERDQATRLEKEREEHALRAIMEAEREVVVQRDREAQLITEKRDAARLELERRKIMLPNACLISSTDAVHMSFAMSYYFIDFSIMKLIVMLAYLLYFVILSKRAKFHPPCANICGEMESIVGMEPLALAEDRLYVKLYTPRGIVWTCSSKGDLWADWPITNGQRRLDTIFNVYSGEDLHILQISGGKFYVTVEDFKKIQALPNRGSFALYPSVIVSTKNSRAATIEKNVSLHTVTIVNAAVETNCSELDEAWIDPLKKKAYQWVIPRTKWGMFSGVDLA